MVVRVKEQSKWSDRGGKNIQKGTIVTLLVITELESNIDIHVYCC